MSAGNPEATDLAKIGHFSNVQSSHVHEIKPLLVINRRITDNFRSQS